MTGNLPDTLPDAVLQRRSALPLKPEPVVLEGEHIRLEPVSYTHLTLPTIYSV